MIVTEENILLPVLKKILLILMGSGLLSNALYIYGLAYYEGYVERIGFEYNLFPIVWNEALLWTYSASREFGASTFKFWTLLTKQTILVMALSVYIVTRIWMSINDGKNQEDKFKRRFLQLRSFLDNTKKKYPKVCRIIYPPLKWLLVREQSLWAFIASYFFLIVIVFIPIFSFIWVYFPFIGIMHGKSIGAMKLSVYEKTLCGDATDFWNQCIEIFPENEKYHEPSKPIIGRVMLRNTDFLGLLTERGPITVSFPKNYNHLTERNPLYKGKGEKKQRKMENE